MPERQVKLLVSVCMCVYVWVCWLGGWACVIRVCRVCVFACAVNVSCISVRAYVCHVSHVYAVCVRVVQRVNRALLWMFLSTMCDRYDR